MAKARKQRSRALVDKNDKPVRPGDAFPVGTDSYAETYRLVKVTKDDRVQVKALDTWITDPINVGLKVKEIGEGCDLHLMEEEAQAMLAAASLLRGMRTTTPESFRSEAKALDGKHDLEYWLRRVSRALEEAGYTLTGDTKATYWELAALVESFQKSRGDRGAL